MEVNVYVFIYAIVICVIIVIFSIIGYYVYKKFYDIKQKKMLINSGDKSNNIEVYFFHTNWCPHCKKALKSYIDFVDTYNKTLINGNTIECINGKDAINCTEEDSSSTNIMNKFDIHEFPSIIFVHDNNIVKFKGKITKQNLMMSIKLL